MKVALFIILLVTTPLAGYQSPNATQHPTAIAVGEIAPEFALLDQNGNRVALSAARGNSPVVLVFYRAHW